MRSQHSLEETAELYGLLENIKKEYEDGIHSVLRKSNPELFSNPHTIPKLKKISNNSIILLKKLSVFSENFTKIEKEMNKMINPSNCMNKTFTIYDVN